jgi:multimeric flavodoxin WrbA
MKVVIINGSPRKNGNTAALCKSFSDGLSSAKRDINIEYIDLYTLQYSGCKSCFGCKRIKGDTYGKCIIKDDLYDLLPHIQQADGIVLGSPIYFGDMNGQMKCFLERLLFPLFTYEKGYRSIAAKRMPIVMLYTMNVKEQDFIDLHYDEHLAYTENFISHVFTKPSRVYAFNTYQFKNYNDYKVETFSEQEKAEYRDKQYPIDLKKAFEQGKSMAETIYRNHE